jgi:hypothetical protein
MGQGLKLKHRVAFDPGGHLPDIAFLWGQSVRIHAPYWRIDQVWPQQPVHIMALLRQFSVGGDKSGGIRNVEHCPGSLVFP